MGNNPLISVVVPIYNTEKYLIKCLDSIVNQTYKNLQIILVDDGSTDNSGMICDDYSLKDNRIKVIHKKNTGVLDTRIVGLDASTGEYIGFVDSDDWIEPNMYEEMMESLIQTDADFVHTGVIREKDGLSKKECKFDTDVIDNPRNNIEIWKAYMYLKLEEGYSINSFLCTKLFKSEMIKRCCKNVPKDVVFGEDRIAIAECFLSCNRVSFLKKAYYHYNYLHPDSCSANKGAKMLFWTFKMNKILFDLFHKYGVYELIEPYIDTILSVRLLRELIRMNFIIPYLFGHVDEIYGKRIVIYGAGKVGYNYYIQLSKNVNCNIVDWVDKNFAGYNYIERKVNPINNIKNADYDLIIIAVKYKKLAEQIINDLITMGIDKNKLCWYEPIQSCYTK